MIKTRPLNDNDKFLLEKAIAYDPDHSRTSNVDFWMPQEGISCFAVEDDLGVIFYVRGETCLRLHMQFLPNEPKSRVAKALTSFIYLIEKNAKEKKYRQIIWESISEKLIQFAEKFGYRKSPNEMVKDLNANNPPNY